MSMGLGHLHSMMQPVIAAQKQNSTMRNQATQQAAERRGQQFATTHQLGFARAVTRA